jgi:DNA topoisomerase-1
MALSGDEKLVYQIIWKYFVASQMSDAVWDTLEVRVSDNENKHSFKSSGKALKSKGYLEIFEFESNAKIQIPLLSKDECVKIKDNIVLDQKFTQPPARYNDATLIEKLEAKEIGRPATYAETLKKICSRNYVEKRGNTYYATETGIKITDILIKNFPFMNFEYTALMEKKLDEIADGKLDYLSMMNDFYSSFKESLLQAYKTNGGEMCKLCKSPMITKVNKQDGSMFMACNSYPSCKNTRKLE